MNTVQNLNLECGSNGSDCASSNGRPRKGVEGRSRAGLRKRLGGFAFGWVALLLCGLSAQAQWVTQSVALKDGWNAVYLHVDPSHATLDELVAGDVTNPIEEIWMWSPNPSAAQFITDPQAPSATVHWLNWSRVPSPSETLTRLKGNVACLVRSSGAYTWNVKGKPVVPNYQWTSSGLNFFGFPTRPGASISFDTFFNPAPDLKVGAEIFGYRGGAIVDNPVQVFDFTTRSVSRGEAFWIRPGNATRYSGPFEIVASETGVRFGDALSQASFRLRNNAPQEITVTLAGIASETAPAGQSAVRGAVPVLVRGEIDPATLTHAHVPLAAGPRQWTLKSKGQLGSEVEVVLGVDRQQMSGAAGHLYASVLRFTDSLNYTQIDMPVSAQVGSPVGLWVGGVVVSSVDHYLNNYATAETQEELDDLLERLGLEEGPDGHFEIDPATKRVLVFGGPENRTGAYLLDGPVRTDAGTVARPFPLRLIVHHDGSTARLLQRAYHGIGLSTNPVVATRQDLLLPAQLASARRISAVHLPATPANIPWDFAGGMQAGGNLTTTIEASFDDQASNPFLHTYHPDHDNLDASFETMQPRGAESYGIRRVITLTFTAPASDFASLTRGGLVLAGDYAEEVTFLGKPGAQRSYRVRGAFALNHIADTPTLAR